MQLQIVSNKQVSKDTYLIKIDNPKIFDAYPGQFVMVRVNNYNYPLLRRPFSVHNLSNTMDLLYRRVGEGTSMLSLKKPGDTIDILGPLGNGFEIKSNKKLILIGGGVGIAPLCFLKKKIMRRKMDCEIYFGFNSKDEICIDYGNIATIDGSFGYKGNVVDMVKDKIEKNSFIYACGPTVMLKKLAMLCYEKKCSMEVSLESRMACGMGVCLGCAVETKNGMSLVCSDGPVFDYKDVLWEKM